MDQHRLTKKLTSLLIFFPAQLGSDTAKKVPRNIFQAVVIMEIPQYYIIL